MPRRAGGGYPLEDAGGERVGGGDHEAGEEVVGLAVPPVEVVFPPRLRDHAIAEVTPLGTGSKQVVGEVRRGSSRFRNAWRHRGRHGGGMTSEKPPGDDNPNGEDGPRKGWPPVDQVRLQRLRRIMEGRWYGGEGPPPEVQLKWARAAARRERGKPKAT